MSRINTNVPSLLAQRILGQNNKSLNKSLERLSTGYAINRGSDNPAGLIASEKLRSEKAAIGAAIGNAERADQVVNIAEGGLQEISGMLTELQSLVTESANEAGLSKEEREANQLQIDSILQTIDRIAATTSFQGVKLLNGTYDFQVNNMDARVQHQQVNAAKLEFGQTRQVQVLVTKSAQHGALFLSYGGTQLDLTNADAEYVFEIAGAQGSREFTFASGTTLVSIASAVNTFTSITGVEASASGNLIYFESDKLGEENFVQFKQVTQGGQAGGIMNASAQNENIYDDTTNQAFAGLTNPIRDEGQDVGAIVNGIKATSDGNRLLINTDFLDLEMTLTEAGSQAQAAINAFTIQKGGAKFMLGPQVNIGNQVRPGITNVAVRNLGSTAVGGFLDDLASGKGSNLVDGDLEQAQTIVNKAIDQVSTLRGRLGAFQRNVVGSTIRSLGVALENTSAAESMIRDTDFAAETAELTRSQILVSASTNVLGIANSQPQAALQLLG